MFINSILLDLPLSPADYEDLFVGMVFLAAFTLLFIIIYLAIGEEREETET